ncbi:MAG: carboxypeptidase-like regulatory domain-containing protein [Elusimicrobia bacterium]|nr:carboxypeptidase-like regulatory domain-containing protein [Elusimicrobiota bacterium]
MDNTAQNYNVREFSGVGILFKNTWGIFRKRIWVLLLIGIIGLVLTCVPAVVFFGLGLAVSKFLTAFEDIIILVTAGIAIIIFFFFANLFQLAFTVAIADENVGIKESFMRTKSKTLSFSWLMTLMCFLITGGCVLFFVPGLVFSVWFFFAPFTFVAEGARGMDALKRSIYYVKGKGWGVLGRLSAVWLGWGIIFVIPVIGQWLALFLIPFAAIFSYLVYKNLRLFKNNETYHPPSIRGAILTGVVGILLVSSFLTSLILTGKLKQMIVSQISIVNAEQSCTIKKAIPKKKPVSVDKSAIPVPVDYYIYGNVVDSERQPVHSVTIKVSQNGKEELRVLSDKNGNFKIREEISGMYDIKAWRSGYKSISKKVDFKKGVPVEINFILEK